MDTNGFRSDLRGNVAALFALAAIPLVGLLGSAVDYSRASSARVDTQAATDAAALAGAQKLSTSASEAEKTASKVFAQNAPAALTKTPPNVTISGNGQVIKVCATGTVQTSIMQVAGFSTLPVTACSEATRPNKQYLDIYMALDVSASMGLAADEAGRDRLRGLTGCAFACHEKEGGQTISNYDVAKQNGILTRVDVLRQATRGLATDLLNPADPPNGLPRNEVRLAMYSLSDDAKKLLAPPTPFLSRVDDEIARIQLSLNTQFQVALPVIDREIGQQGDGTDRLKPRKMLFLVTDGVQSKRNQPWESSAFRPIDVALCTTLKQRGVPVAVLNIRYVPMPGDAAYMGTVGRFQTQLAPALRACATEGFYFEAENPDEIKRAFAEFSGKLTSYRLSR